MHYLIDGHNLIARMPDIDLADPDDEAQLILRLRRWTAASGKRRVTVYFDGGLPGGRAPHLSGNRIDVIFASSGGSADHLLLKRIARVKNPPEYTLVTSDREIARGADKREMPIILSEAFAQQLAEEVEGRQQPEAPRRRRSEKPLLSEEEVALWMELFGPEPDIPPQPPRKRTRRGKPAEEESAPSPSPEPLRDAAELKDSGDRLSEAEVAAWLDMFGSGEEDPREEEGDSESQTVETATEFRRRQRERRRQKRRPPRPADRMKDSGAALSEDEVEEWLDIFSEADE